MSWAAAVYENDKRCAELCREMSWAGFGFDREAAKAMSRRLLELELQAREAADLAVGRPIARTETNGFGTADLRRAFFEDLGAPIYLRSALTKQPSLSVDALRFYASGKNEDLRKLSLAVLDCRRFRKVRSTYIDNCPVSDDSRVHPSWLSYGAVSGRFACQHPNLMNLPTMRIDPTIIWQEVEGKRKAVSGGIRSLYVAKPGFTLLMADAKQLEMRIAAFASGDPRMIEACQARDLHAGNAEVIFGEAFTTGDEATRYSLRNLAKQSGFACCYLAEADTIWARLLAEGQRVELRQVQAMLRKLKREFAGYFEWQARRLLDCVRLGYTETPMLGRRRWLGHDPSPTECANFPIQGGAADLMNFRLPAIANEMARKLPAARLVAQVHDSGVFEVPEAAAEEAKEIYQRIFEAPIRMRSGLSGEMIEASFPLDIEVKRNWK